MKKTQTSFEKDHKKFVDHAGDDKSDIVSELEQRTEYTKEKITKDDPVVQALLEGLLNGQRSALAKSITLAETVHPRKKAQAQALLEEVSERSKRKAKKTLHKTSSFRIGM